MQTGTTVNVLRRLVRTPSALGGVLILLLAVIAAVFAPWVAPSNPYDLTTVSLRNSLLPPIWFADGRAPYLFGTDEQGRDILSLIIYGLRTSLLVSLGVVGAAGILGGFLGLLAGYYEGALGGLIMRMADLVYAFPAILVAILLSGLIEGSGIAPVILAISAIYWVRYARTMRSKVLGEKALDYVQAARAIGADDRRILVRHLLPNCLPPLLVLAAVDIAVVIMLEATLSFLGVGVPLTEPSLGQVIYMGKGFIQAGKWWLIVFPGGALVVLVIAINLVADWLRLALSPRILLS